MWSEGALEVEDVAFDAEGVTLHGWLYPPRAPGAAAPVVVMAHGYNCIKELYLELHRAAYPDQFERAAHAATASFVEHLRRAAGAAAT